MTFEDQITRAFETLTERLRGEIGQQVQRTAAELAAAAPRDRASVDAGAGAAPQAAADAASRARLAEGFEAIDRARSLTAVLDTLVAFARAEAGRADVWLIRGGRPYLWRAPESGEAADATPPRSPDEGIPLALGGTTVAVLLANSELGTENSELRTRNSELGTQNSELGTQNSELGTQNSELGTQNSELGTQNVERRTPNAERRTPNAERRTSNVVLLARYAAKSLESLTAFTTARALTHKPDHDGAGGLRNAEDDPRPEEDGSARRYARLLVSEIKLYHEAAVIDGRRDRDLAVRLGGEIARARVMYEQRVPAHVRERADYFQDELVKTLANGDASLLELRT